MTREEWLQYRHSGLGSSDAPAIMGKSPWKTRMELYQEKIKDTYEELPSNFAMERGNQLEPIARTKFTSHFALNESTEIDFQPRLAQLSAYPFMKASLDAANMDGPIEVFAEIKYQGKDDFASREVPEKYFWQVQHQFLVTGAKRAFFVGINDQEEIKVLEVAPDMDAMRNLLAECILFWECVQSKTEPALTPQDYKAVDTAQANALSELYLKYDQEIKALEQLKEEAKNALIELCDHPRVIIGKLKICEATRVGNVDYKAIPELRGVDLDKYRKPGSTYWKINTQSKEKN